jgi:hypothetical protein
MGYQYAQEKNLYIECVENLVLEYNQLFLLLLAILVKTCTCMKK